MNCSRILRTTGCVIRQVSKATYKSSSINLSLNRPTIRWSSTDTKEPGDAKVEAKEPIINEPEVDDLGDIIPPDSNIEKILSLEKEVRDLKDRVVRSLAEEENVRRNESDQPHFCRSVLRRLFRCKLHETVHFY